MPDPVRDDIDGYPSDNSNWQEKRGAIKSQSFEALCSAKLGGAATLPATASNEMIEEALAKVLQLRMEYITQTYNRDFAQQAADLAHYLV